MPTLWNQACHCTVQAQRQGQQQIDCNPVLPGVVACGHSRTPTLLLQAREGDWFPAGLSFGDMRGLAGYKIFLSVALLLGEGAFILAKAALLGEVLEVYDTTHHKHSTNTAQTHVFLRPVTGVTVWVLHTSVLTTEAGSVCGVLCVRACSLHLLLWGYGSLLQASKQLAASVCADNTWVVC